MGCFGDREHGPTKESQKWEFLTLSDFRCTSNWTVFAYIWVWIMALVGLIVYGLDTFTAINLLAFNRWSSQVKPALDFKYTKWIFAICILLSFLLLFYESWRAIRVIQRGGVVESYLDPLAASWQSMRGSGWRRFLVFTALTKSRKGLDYVALFTYITFTGAPRIILAEGPRQAVNAMTLYAVMQAELLGPTKDNHSPIVQFFLNVQAVAEKDLRQALIYFSMLFTLVIWAFSFLSLVIAALLYIIYLWHTIHQRLSRYCREKLEKRLARLVESKVKAALEEEERKRLKALRKNERKLEHKSGHKKPKVTERLLDDPPPKLVRQPTLPQLGDSPQPGGDKLPEFELARQDTNGTTSTLPVYESRPPTRADNFGSQGSLSVSNRPGMPARSGTQASGGSYASDAPLIANASEFGESEAGLAHPPPIARRQGSFASEFSMPRRTMSQNAFRPPPGPDRTMSESSYGDRRPQLPALGNSSDSSQVPYASNEPGSRLPPRIPLPVRSNSTFSFDQPSSASTYGGPPGPFGPPPRANTAQSFRSGPMRQGSNASSMMTAPPYQQSRGPTPGPMNYQTSYNNPPPPSRQGSQASFARPFAPRAQSPDAYEMTAQPPRSASTQPPSNGGGYMAFQPPSRANSTAPRPPSGPQRNITIAGPPGVEDNYFGQVRAMPPQRSATAPIEPRHTIGYSGILDDYGSDSTPAESNGGHRQPSPPAGPGLARAATAQPQGSQGENYWPLRR